MADKLADLSPEDREKRIAELKAKMQAAAKKAQANPAEEVAPAAPAAKATKEVKPAVPEAMAVEPVSGSSENPVQPTVVSPGVEGTALKEADVAVHEPEPAQSSNGTPGNGVAAAAAVASATVVDTAPIIAEETPEERQRKEMNRREFLTYAWGAALGLLLLETGAATFFFMMPRFKAGEFGGQFFLSTSEIPPLDAPPVPYTAGKFWLVDAPEAGPKALYMVCTHLGCLYKWAQSNNRFECPCHGSKFTKDGYYIEGPAPRSLDTFVVTTEGDILIVDTGAKIPGEPSADSPARVLAA